MSRLFRSFATLVSWLRVTLASWFYHAWNVFVDSRYAWTVFVVSRYGWTVFVYSSYAWNVFVVSSYAWTVFVVLSYARLVFVTSSYACFVTSCHACFVACHACFRDFVSRLVIYPRVTVCPRLFRSLELRWFFVAFGLRLTCRFRAALVSWPLCCACYSLRVSSSIENKFFHKYELSYLLCKPWIELLLCYADFALLGFILKYKYEYKLMRFLYSKSLFINLFLGIFKYEVNVMKLQMLI